MPDLYARVSEAEHEAAARFAAEHDVTITGLAAALCRWLDSGEEVNPEVERCVKWIISEASQIDAERRSRHQDEA